MLDVEMSTFNMAVCLACFSTDIKVQLWLTGVLSLALSCHDGPVMLCWTSANFDLLMLLDEQSLDHQSLLDLSNEDHECLYQIA